MAPPVAVYVVAAVVGIAAALAFKEVRSCSFCIPNEETRALTRPSFFASRLTLFTL